MQQTTGRLSGGGEAFQMHLAKRERERVRRRQDRRTAHTENHLEPKIRSCQSSKSHRTRVVQQQLIKGSSTLSYTRMLTDNMFYIERVAIKRENGKKLYGDITV